MAGEHETEQKVPTVHPNHNHHNSNNTNNNNENKKPKYRLEHF